MREWAGARRCFAAAGLALLGACGGSGGAAKEPALETARGILGPTVQHAFDVPMGRDRRFLATAVPARPGGIGAREGSVGGETEIVMLDIHEGGNQVIRPGLYADSVGEGDTPGFARVMGTEDVTGDGKGEVWAARRTTGGRSRGVEISLYSHGVRAMYTLVASTGADDETRLDVLEMSPNTERHPEIRAWLANKAGAVAGELTGAKVTVDTTALRQAGQR